MASGLASLTVFSGKRLFERQGSARRAAV